jgi:putative alpha-1,2-mannosidase
VLNLPNGKTFTIRAEHLTLDNKYVSSVSLNGKPLAVSFLRHEQITAGGELVFRMQAAPNKEWGMAKSARPYSQTAY